MGKWTRHFRMELVPLLWGEWAKKVAILFLCFCTCYYFLRKKKFILIPIFFILKIIYSEILNVIRILYSYNYCVLDKKSTSAEKLSHCISIILFCRIRFTFFFFLMKKTILCGDLCIKRETRGRIRIGLEEFIMYFLKMDLGIRFVPLLSRLLLNFQQLCYFRCTYFPSKRFSA